MPSGTVKKLVTERGFGFIDTGRPREDVFFHHTGVADHKFDDLVEGQSVSYEIEQDPDKDRPRAVNVRTVA